MLIHKSRAAGTKCNYGVSGMEATMTVGNAERIGSERPHFAWRGPYVEHRVGHQVGIHERVEWKHGIENMPIVSNAGSDQVKDSTWSAGDLSQMTYSAVHQQSITARKPQCLYIRLQARQ